MKRSEYERLRWELMNPYAVWIREKEIERKEEGLRVPEGYLLFSDEDGSVSPGLSSALSDYGAFKDGYDLIYTDEDVMDESGRHDPFFKPDHSPDTLDSFYYPGGLTIVSRELAELVSEKTDYQYGSLEYLRECGCLAGKVLHIPEVLYHASRFKDYKYRDRVEKEENCPEAVLSVIILSKDHPELTRLCVGSLKKSAEKEKITPEFVVIDNGSNEENTRKYENLSEELGFEYRHFEMEFVYSRLCNIGADISKGELLLFLNDDVEVPDNTIFLSKMMREAVKKKTGAVGCKLLYPGEERIQHCGITLLKTGASHKLSGYTDDREYYRGVNRIKRNVFAVTGACLMVERKKFMEIGGFDERLAVAYTDVDLCSALLLKGYYNLCLNDFHLIHHESLSRDNDEIDKGKFERLMRERAYYYDKYRDLISKGDPWYNVNLTETGLDYAVNVDVGEDRVPLYESLNEVNVKDKGKGIFIQGKDESIYLRRSLKPGKFLSNIDFFGVRQSDAKGHDEFLEVRGWAFIHGRPGYEYDPAILIKRDKDFSLYEATRMERGDLSTVFPADRATELSGFS